MRCRWCGVEIVMACGSLVFNGDRYDAAMAAAEFWTGREDGDFFCATQGLQIHEPVPLTTERIVADLESMEIDLR
jgi:hypothetical protein